MVVVPAFTGLGAPYWDPLARGAILGLTRGSGQKEIVTATLQAVGLQTRDLVDAMSDDGIRPSVIRVDGGMVMNFSLDKFPIYFCSGSIWIIQVDLAMGQEP